MISDVYNKSCRSCGLCDLATSVCVPGRYLDDTSWYEGRPTKVLIVSEAPGPEDDQKNSALLGRAGKKLVDLLQKVDIPLSCVYVTNSAKCFPRTSDRWRAPSQDEVITCASHYLSAELQILQPDIIVPLGTTSLQLFLGSVTISKSRGKLYKCKFPTDSMVEKGIFDVSSQTMYSVFPSYNPAFVLYNPTKEPELLNDLCFLQEQVTGKRSVPHDKYQDLSTKESLDRYFDDLDCLISSKLVDIVAVDLETGGPLSEEERKSGGGGLRPFDAENLILSLSISHKVGQGVFIPYRHPESPWAYDQTMLHYIRKRVSSVLCRVPSVGHNYKFDLNWLRFRDFACGDGPWHDTMLMSWVLYNDTVPSHGLEYLASMYTDMISHKHEMQEEMKSKGTKSFTSCSLDVISKYNPADTDATLRLYQFFKEELIRQNLWGVYTHLMSDAIAPHQDMEYNGCKIDVSRLYRTDAELSSRSKDIYDKIRGWYGEKVEQACGTPSGSFSLTSPIQLGVLITKCLHIDIDNISKEPRTAKGQISTAKGNIKEYISYYAKLANESTDDSWKTWASHVKEVLELVKEFKGIEKLRSAYINSLPKFLDADNIVHPTFGIRTTATGRDTVRDPGLQLIPFRSPIKKLFVSRWTDGLILQADYQALEVRVLAMITGEPKLAEIFRKGTDIHREVASQILGIPPEDVTPPARRSVKAAHFGLIYGRGAPSIAEQEGISVEKAQEVIDGYFRTFTRVRDWINERHREVDRDGRVFTMHGARRLIIDQDRGTRHRRAQNTPVQGTATDIGQEALQGVTRSMRESGLKSLSQNFVHDSLVFDLYPGELLPMAAIMLREMTIAPSLRHSWASTVPLEVDMELGVSWGHPCHVKFIDESKLEVSGLYDYVHKLWSVLDCWPNPPEMLSYEEYKNNEDELEVKSLLSFPLCEDIV